MPNRPERLHLLDDRFGILVGVLELRRDRDHLARDEAAHGRDAARGGPRDRSRRSCRAGACGSRYPSAGENGVTRAGRGHRRYRTSRDDGSPHDHGFPPRPTSSSGSEVDRDRAAAGARLIRARTACALIGFVVDGGRSRDRRRRSRRCCSAASSTTPCPTRTARSSPCSRWPRSALAFANAVLSLVQRWFSARIGEGLIYDLRVALFDHVQRMPIAFFTRTQTGALQIAAQQRRDRRAAGGHEHARHRRLERDRHRGDARRSCSRSSGS